MYIYLFVFVVGVVDLWINYIVIAEHTYILG